MQLEEELKECILVDEVVRTIEEFAEEQGREDYREIYGDVDLCPVCIEFTPLDPPIGLFGENADRIERIETIAVRELSGCKNVRKLVRESYSSGFRSHSVAECDACSGDLLDDGEMCGHERRGGNCPA